MFERTDPNNILFTIYGVIIFATFATFWHRKRFFKLSRQFPGPMELPFIGIFHRVSQPKDILYKLYIVLRVYKVKTIFTYFGPQPLMYTMDPEILEKVLTSAELFNKADLLYGPLSNLFGDGLFSSKSPKWNHHRKLINPSFRLPVLRTFFPIFNRNSRQFTDNLKALVGTGPHNLSDILQKLTLSTAMENILGKEMPNGSQVDDEILNHYTRVMKSTLVMILLGAIKLSGIAKLLNFYKSRKAVFDFVDDIILQKLSKTSFENVAENNNVNNLNKNNNNNDDLYFKAKKGNFITEALKIYDRKEFTWQDVTDESNSIIFAAFDTTASTLLCCLSFLAMHPSIQEKLYEEIISVFPEKNIAVDYEQLQDCAYLDMVVNETVRLAPSVPTIGRGVDEDMQLTPDIMLPKGLIILIGIFELHRNQEIWGPAADEFNPDNFLPENVAQRHPYSFIPFSRGMRNCIGGRYATMAIKVFLLHILRNYRLTTKFQFKNLEFINYVTLKLVQTPTFEVHKREN